ncbi:MAG TPA: DUF418 domain-containing protein [Allosphingosinicella sp.]|nr:DUF418 domain-containing protein [Allosphingosinicella sp.]
MTASTDAGQRIAALDIVRGVAVMGILAMNIVAFAMPSQAYMNPIAYGMESSADLAAWVFSFIFVDGKMRGLFSLLFGASMLLVIERAQAAGQSAARAHFSRAGWLLVFGLLHFYLIWFGDILVGYALIAMIAFLFRNMAPRALVIWGGALVAVQLLVFAGFAVQAAYLRQGATQAAPDPATVRQWLELNDQLGVLSGEKLIDKLALFLGPYGGLVRHRLLVNGAEPFTGIFIYGWETLAYMLFGMAALKTGFLKVQWRPADYFKVAVAGLAVTVPAYVLLAWIVASDGFSVPAILAFVLAATVPFRPLMVMAYAAAIILLTRGRGALVARVAAAGRAAFTNYLGTSILMTSLFYGYGLGLYGSMSRIETWLVVWAMWALMLIWSKPWLDRYRYGPFEWLWRSLARWQLQPMRRPAA